MAPASAVFETLELARLYVAAGFPTLPIRMGGKKPALRSWKPYQDRVPTEDELPAMFGRAPRGIALVQGRVSQSEVLDFDDGPTFEEWLALCRAESIDLSALPIVRTPRGGAHVYLKRARPAGNQKLAKGERDGTVKALIETRGEAGYAVAPSPVICHPKGKPYVQVAGPPLQEWASVPRVDHPTHQALLALASSFNEVADAIEEGSPRMRESGEGLPGTEFDQKGTWEEALNGHGEIVMVGSKRCWRRPGKDDRGISGTLGYCKTQDGRELLFVFSTNATPLLDRRAYSKFATLAFLSFGGDFRAAAAELRRRGYGRSNGQVSTASKSTAKLLRVYPIGGKTPLTIERLVQTGRGEDSRVDAHLSDGQVVVFKTVERITSAAAFRRTLWAHNLLPHEAALTRKNWPATCKAMLAIKTIVEPDEEAERAWDLIDNYLSDRPALDIDEIRHGYDDLRAQEKRACAIAQRRPFIDRAYLFLSPVDMAESLRFVNLGKAFYDTLRSAGFERLKAARTGRFIDSEGNSVKTQGRYWRGPMERPSHEGALPLRDDPASEEEVSRGWSMALRAGQRIGRTSPGPSASATDPCATTRRPWHLRREKR